MSRLRTAVFTVTIHHPAPLWRSRMIDQTKHVRNTAQTSFAYHHRLLWVVS